MGLELLKTLLPWAIAAGAVGSFVAQRGDRGHDHPRERSVTVPPEALADARVLGRATARLSVVEFGDYTCRYCARAQPTLDSLVQLPGAELSIAYLHLVSSRPHAEAAAIASECAAYQGRFQEMHRLLLAQQDSLGQLPWSEFARRSGVPSLKEFEACLSDERPRARLARDREIARALHVEATPSFLVGRRLYRGMATRDELTAGATGANR